MKPSKSGFEPVWQTQHPAQCRELRLVLESVGIASQTIQQDGWWWLIVASEDLPVAAVEIEQYQLENHGNSKSQPLERTRVYSGAAAGVVGYISVILLVACLRIEAFFDRDWLLAGRMVAGPVTSGEWWRVITALTLHVDAEHIYSNLIFGAVFGFLAGRLLGGGIAWLGITLAGSFGNLLNAMIQSDDHSSIGASTAVFAALGVMVSHALFPMDKHENRFKRWSPLIAGIALLGFTGTGGERTDVTAHITGFLAGVVVGLALRRIPIYWLGNRRVQLAAGFVAIVVVLVAWAIALQKVNTITS